MSSILRRLRSLMIIGSGLLAGCQATSVPQGLPDVPTAPVQTQADQTTLPPATGEVLGTGPSRVALLLPLSAEGSAGQIGREFRNAAALAMEDIGSDALQLVIKDTGRDPAQVQAAASSAVLEGSSLVLGPIFASDVSAAAAVTRPAGKTMIAFSSDRNVAGARVYLNSFLPAGVVERVVSHATQNGVRSVLGFFANGPAGDLAERAARAALQNTGTLAASVRYDPNEASIQQAAAAAVAALPQSEAILIPEGGPVPSAILRALSSNGGDIRGKRLLGTGQWTSASLSDPILEGAWFADSDQARLATFKSRYAAKFGAEPSPNAALAYDTVVMAGTAAKRYGTGAFSNSVIEADAGFAGYTGIFRFEPDGTTERGYAVYEVQPGGATRVISPSPRSFAGGAS
ncbi:MAG TPA: penicillin-binding protein activator [Tianweitania sediminis]|nr:penicillin-binding protein activator [Tianweitania sediminis]